MAALPEISVVVPCHNEENNIPELERRIAAVMTEIGVSYEILLINDGSRDGTLVAATGVAKKNPSVCVVDLTRNFGHQLAATAGLDLARGQAVVIIDADLQDPPELIKDMVREWRQGFEVVFGRRTKREGETWFKIFTAALFYRFLRLMTQTDIPVDAGDFRLMDRKVVDSIKAMHEKHRFLRGMVSWVGFRQKAVEYTRQRRHAGRTNYPFWKMLRFAVDAVTSFSVLPLRLVTGLGFVVILAAFTYGIGIMLVKLLWPDAILPGFTALNFLIAMLGGVQLISLGVVGEYVGRIYEESKGRPLYLIRTTFQFDEQHDSATRR